MELVTKAEVEVARAPDLVFDLAVDPRELPRFLKKVGPIPGVVAVEMEGDAAPAAGARRQVTMSDGSQMGEEITSLDRPRGYAYRWVSPPPAPFNLLVRTARTECRFAPSGLGTRVTWTYRLELTSLAIYPLAWVVIRLFRRWMVSALAGLSRLAAGAER
jgi:uncharacterized protein YndB with AHSA1/START domain